MQQNCFSRAYETTVARSERIKVRIDHQIFPAVLTNRMATAITCFNETDAQEN